VSAAEKQDFAKFPAILRKFLPRPSHKIGLDFRPGQVVTNASNARRKACPFSLRSSQGPAGFGFARLILGTGGGVVRLHHYWAFRLGKRLTHVYRFFYFKNPPFGHEKQSVSFFFPTRFRPNHDAKTAQKRRGHPAKLKNQENAIGPGLFQIPP